MIRLEAEAARGVMHESAVIPRDGAIIFGDLIGKLDGLRIECAKCGRSGRYVRVPHTGLKERARKRQIQ
ncbi:MAG TPA: hypothetical protein VF913_11930 [Xanthobacteraceae bacterium]